MLFAFCRQWVWDQTIAFLEKEKYSAQSLDSTDRILSSLHRIIRQNKWPANPSRCVPLLYLLGKAKSLLKGTILWRPIAAIVQPQIQRFYLRNAARAFTLFLRLLVEEITASFLVLRICDLQPWVHGLSDWGCTQIAECDCSGQFNNVTPLQSCRTCQQPLNGSLLSADGMPKRWYGAYTVTTNTWTAQV